MLNIDKKELLYLLETRRKYLEVQKGDGLGEIIASISLMVTLALSDYSNLSIVNPLIFGIVVWGIAIIILLFGVYAFIKSVLSPYTVERLAKEIESLDPDVEHSFNLAVIRSPLPDGKYLVFKSKRWGCWLFPNYHCLESGFDAKTELEQVTKKVRRDLNEDLSFTYIGDVVSSKYSVGDKVKKTYHFYFFQATDCMNGLQGGGFRKKFNLNGKVFGWKTLDQLYSDSKTSKRNGDVLDYIRKYM